MAATNLKTQGFRFKLSPDGRDCDWFHPAEAATSRPDWTDCTDMGDDEFALLLDERLRASRIPA